MKIIRCDRCGKEIPRGKWYVIVKASTSDALRIFKEMPCDYDLCENCGKALALFIHGQDHTSLDPIESLSLSRGYDEWENGILKRGPDEEHTSE